MKNSLLSQISFSQNIMRHVVVVIVTVISITVAAVPSELHRGFEATAESTQPHLVDPTGNFSLAFLRSSDLISLAVIHIPSNEPVWTTSFPHPVQWNKRIRLTFNGSLVITDPNTGAIWSTETENGERVTLSASSNLVVESGSDNPVWESFKFPSNTLVEGQNGTTLVSSNGLYTLRLGPDYIALYAKFNANKPDQIYYKRTAIQAKATIVIGQGPIHIRVSPDGYLGTYQNGSDPADVQSFSSYLRPVPGIRIIRLEQDGNLKAYYWSKTAWVLDYEAIRDTCELPSACGPYSLCRAGSNCSSLGSGQIPHASGDFCTRVGYTEIKRVGVELPYKELMEYTETASYWGCEEGCKSNCTCWGVVYSNASGRCYGLDYPVQTLLEVGDAGKVGYFKVRAGAGSAGKWRAGIGLLCVGGLMLVLAVGFGWYRVWMRRREFEREDGPYKDLGSHSFGSVELNARY